MAYLDGTATGPEDLLDELFTFAGANGWTVDQATNGSQAYLSKGDIYVGFYYTADALKIYPATGFSGASPIPPPDEQTGVAYNDTLTTIGSGMSVNELTGPHSSYYFFESDTYLHVVVHVNTDRYRHFGFGLMNQAGSMAVGSYFTGHYHSQTASDINTMLDQDHAGPYSGYITSGPNQGGMWVRGRKSTSPETALSGAPHVDSKWYNSRGTGTDGDSVAYGKLLVSGTNSSRSAAVFGVGSSLFNGFTPLTPINLFLWDESTAPDNIYPLGSVPDVRLVNVESFTDGQEVTIGSDTWVIFPVGRKGFTTAQSPVMEGTGHMGLAYKKVTT